MTNINSTINVLIVDDEIEYREVIQMILEDVGYDADVADSAEQALLMLDEKIYHIVLTDLKMGQLDGIDLLKIIKKKFASIEVILITGNGTIENAVDAIKIGATNYIVKTQPSEKLLMEIEAVSKKVLLKLQNSKNTSDFEYLTKTNSPVFSEVIKTVEKAAISNANILILGESGVGKEMIAHYIHACSNRKSENFIPVHCSSISETLLESELFGHEKGAFTGAVDRREGLFKAADKGTLFLDEIGDISLSIQVKLLRALETRKIQSIGSSDFQTIDFRLVCATNKDLTKAIEQGDFREDFYYRINTIVIEIPPLRKRREDIKMFIEYFTALFGKRLNKEVSGIDDEVMSFLLNHSYQGNIRELKNIMERLVVLSENRRIKKSSIPVLKLDESFSVNDKTEIHDDRNGLSIEDIKPLKEVRQELEADYIEQTLKLCKYNVSEAARKLDLSRRQLYNKMNQYNL